MDLQPGMCVTPSVRLVQELGRGGMGSVWVADHTSLGTRVAVKFLSSELLEEDPNMLERFNREASMSAQIKSPYVVQTFDHGVMDDGRPYIVMELLEGESLSELLDRRELSLQEIANIVAQTAKALSKAHKLGIVHRDIKPDNLFITYEDDEMFLKVLDFGIAKQTGLPKASSVTSTGVMIGTPEFMSPEQVLSSKSVDYRSDLWALGVVAYYCITRGVPFTGETLGSLCVAIANGAFEAPSKLRPGLHMGVDNWFLKALATHPGDRFDSAKQLAVTFAQALTGEVVDDFSSPGLPSGDWSGGHRVVTLSDPAMRDRIPSDALSLAQSGARDATVAASGGTGVPTFAGATIDPDVPKRRRTMAALGVVVALVAVGGSAFLLMAQDAPPEAAQDSGEPPARAAGAQGTGPTTELPASPETDAASATSAETVAPTPSAEASSEEPSPRAAQDHAPTQAQPQRPPPRTTQPKTTAPQPSEPKPAPKPTGDKYGF